MFQEGEPVRGNVLDISCIARDQVINTDDFVTFSKKEVAQV
jgi:hypothetical protein